MQRHGNYCNKQPQKMNEFSGMTHDETSHFAIKIYFIVIFCLVDVDIFMCSKALCYFLYRNAKTERLHTISAR
jgi:hypothetical protein